MNFGRSLSFFDGSAIQLSIGVFLRASCLSQQSHCTLSTISSLGPAGDLGITSSQLCRTAVIQKAHAGQHSGLRDLATRATAAFAIDRLRALEPAVESRLEKLPAVV